MQKFGNSGHIVLPKEYIGKRIKFVAETKTFSQIKSEIIDTLEPYLENILGVYLYGSYARNEQNLQSDIDILVITDKKIEINLEDYEITIVLISKIKDSIKKDIFLYSTIKEAIPILNKQLLEELRNEKFNPKSINWFIDTTKSSIKINEEFIELDKLEGEYISSYNVIYSLLLRLRGVYLIKSILYNKKFSNKNFEDWLSNYISIKEIKDIYEVYRCIRDEKIIKDIKIEIKSAICLLNLLKKEIKKIE